MRTYAVIENKKVTNIIVGVEPEVLAANPTKFVDYTDGWDYSNGIDGGMFFSPQNKIAVADNAEVSPISIETAQ